MARWLDGAPAKMRSPNLKEIVLRDHESAAERNSRSTAGILARGEPWFGGARSSPWQKLAGVEIWRAAWREEEDEVVRRGERMRFYRAAGYL
jgi:hypothetical protein